MFREGWFQRFCTAVDSNGGHMVVLVFVLGMFIATWFAGMKEGERHIDIILGGLLLAMKGRNGKDAPPVTTESPKQ